MLSETVELRGHIIDSLILPKVLDEILTRGANFKIAQVKIGQKRTDQSFARIEVSAESSEALDDLILRLRQHGAEVAEKGDAQLAPAPSDGIFPADFYVTTNQQTFVRIGGREFEVRAPMLDSAIMFDRQQEIARRFFFPTQVGGGTINGEPFAIGRTAAPILPGLPAHIECRVERIVETDGDHAVVILRVVEAECRDQVRPLTIAESPWEYGG